MAVQHGRANAPQGRDVPGATRSALVPFIVTSYDKSHEDIPFAKACAGQASYRRGFDRRGAHASHEGAAQGRWPQGRRLLAIRAGSADVRVLGAGAVGDVAPVHGQALDVFFGKMHRVDADQIRAEEAEAVEAGDGTLAEVAQAVGNLAGGFVKMDVNR